MERITYTQVAGTKYPLNFSTRVAEEITEKYGSLDEISNLLYSGKSDKTPLLELGKTTRWLLWRMMRDGLAYCGMCGEEVLPKLPQEEDLEVLLAPVDIYAQQVPLWQAVTAGMATTVEVDPEKNIETTQGL